MAFFYQSEICFTCLEKHLDLPPLPIIANDFLFREIRICADKGDPVLLVLLITDTNNFSRYLPVFSDHDMNGEQILAAAAALLANAKDFT